ncbi:maleylpyruvate isomerase N-terminal domain-containing protein [Luteimicrobium sp. NPDC057192]|uniref:maleylpyruvate isomerase N-terminal domain-containing protein n=1 Tax=Luteimicrobium sp. NPDC057192 TaxID=3346042 RepID=UPI003629B839
MRTPDRSFLAAADVALDLLADPAVEARWAADSVLERMTVGMLACHLGRQLVRAAEILPVPANAAPLDAPEEHYRRAAWVRAPSLDDPANDRSTDAAEAEAGPGPMLDRCRGARREVGQLLEAGGAQDVVTIPWQGWSLRREDFLLTRLVEVVVHSDDLARSVGVATPEFPRDVAGPVLHLLVELSAERHGQAAIVSALARRERMPDTISAF